METNNKALIRFARMILERPQSDLLSKMLRQVEFFETLGMPEKAQEVRLALLDCCKILEPLEKMYKRFQLDLEDGKF